MELSYYKTKQLLAVKEAIEWMIQESKNKPERKDFATDLTYMLGEFRMALDDKEIDKRRLPFGNDNSITLFV